MKNDTERAWEEFQASDECKLMLHLLGGANTAGERLSVAKALFVCGRLAGLKEATACALREMGGVPT